MIVHKPAQIFSGKRPIGHHTDIAWAVADFPGFTDRPAGRQGFAVELSQFAPAPDALLKYRLECQRVKHGCGCLVIPGSQGEWQERSSGMTEKPGSQAMAGLVNCRREWCLCGASSGSLGIGGYGN